MNLLKLSFFLVFAITLAACGDDDSSPACVQADWVGTYTGTQNCDGASEAVTVTITAAGPDAIIIMYETATVGASFDPITINGCSVERSQSDQGVTVAVEGSLNGDNLTFQDIITFGTDSEICNITATRQ